jgi:putative ubiquitin-RnfH superfamily antitoxin RatB of RatAB toxin-antitoxin module
MGSASDAGLVAVTLAWSPAEGTAEELALVLPQGSTLLDGLRAGGLLEALRTLGADARSTGIWGRLCPLDTPLRDGDRIEIYRPLQVDPMEARRARQRRQRATCSRPR